MPPAYYYNGNLRWSLFWDSPNCAAAFLACLLGWLWWLEFLCKDKAERRAGFIAGFGALCAAELMVWLLLAKTYSRGGLLAAVSGMLFFFVLRSLPDGKIGSCVRHLAARVAIIALVCTVAGFSTRMTPGYMMHDDSVSNRLEFWKGALVMMSDSPLHGWGGGMGGLAYVNWYQPLESTVRPLGFVNSYLEVAVEYGTPVLFVVMACALACIFIAAKQRGRHDWALAGGSVLVAWFSANLLSSLWSKPDLWAVPAAALLCVIAADVTDKKPSARLFAVSSVLSLALCVSLVFAGALLSRTSRHRACPVNQSDVVTVTGRNNDRTGQPVCEIWVDRAVFGSFWGRPLRAMLGESPTLKLFVYAPWARSGIRLDESPRASVYSGFHAGAINENRNPARKTIILHPGAFPPAGSVAPGGKRVVCLAEFDGSAHGLPWRIWAEKNADLLLYSPQGGSRITDSADLDFWRALISND